MIDGAGWGAGGYFRARASRWRNLAAGGIMPSWRPAGGLIAKLLEEIALKSHMSFAEVGDGGVRMFSRAAYRGMATSCARRRRRASAACVAHLAVLCVVCMRCG